MGGRRLLKVTPRGPHLAQRRSPSPQKPCPTSFLFNITDPRIFQNCPNLLPPTASGRIRVGAGHLGMSPNLGVTPGSPWCRLFSHCSPARVLWPPQQAQAPLPHPQWLSSWLIGVRGGGSGWWSPHLSSGPPVNPGRTWAEAPQSPWAGAKLQCR